MRLKLVLIPRRRTNTRRLRTARVHRISKRDGTGPLTAAPHPLIAENWRLCAGLEARDAGNCEVGNEGFLAGLLSTYSEEPEKNNRHGNERRRDHPNDFELQFQRSSHL